MNMFMYHASRFVTRMVAKLLFGYTTKGLEHFPKSGPVLIVANHASFLDPALLGTSSPRIIRFLARATLANHRLLGWWMRSVGTLLIDREAPSHRALEAGVEVLRDGGVFAVFPEGTRSATGAVGEFKRGPLLMIKQTGAAVVPCGIAGTFACWPRDRSRPRLRRPCEVRFGAPMTAAEVLAPGGYEQVRARVAALAGAPLAAVTVKSSGTASGTASSTASSTVSGSDAETQRSSSSEPSVKLGPECPAPGQPAEGLSSSGKPSNGNPGQQPGGPAALPSRREQDGVRPAG